MKFQIVEKNSGKIVAFNWEHVAHVYYTPGGEKDIYDRVVPKSVSVTLIAPAQGEFGTEALTLQFTADDAVDAILRRLYHIAAEE